MAESLTTLWQASSSARLWMNGRGTVLVATTDNAVAIWQRAEGATRWTQRANMLSPRALNVIFVGEREHIIICHSARALHAYDTDAEIRDGQQLSQTGTSVIVNAICALPGKPFFLTWRNHFTSTFSFDFSQIASYYHRDRLALPPVQHMAANADCTMIAQTGWDQGTIMYEFGQGSDLRTFAFSNSYPMYHIRTTPDTIYGFSPCNEYLMAAQAQCLEMSFVERPNIGTTYPGMASATAFTEGGEAKVMFHKPNSDKVYSRLMTGPTVNELLLTGRVNIKQIVASRDGQHIAMLDQEHVLSVSNRMEFNTDALFADLKNAAST